ncbi:MAG: EAL domain-containing protein [Clostridiales bacterium]|nr:EAL domain-containing protein [Clostridiales bacterium]
MKDIIVGRQAIVNKASEIVAYELLYRRNLLENCCCNDITSDYKDSQSLINSVHEIGTEKVLNGQIGFFNITEEILLDIENYNLPQNSILEIVEFDLISKEMLKGILHVKKLGYKLALDDFLFRHIDNQLIDLVDLIKVDYIDCTKKEIEQIMMTFRGKNKIMLAEKIETLETFNHATELGFDLFQGYYFSRPAIISKEIAGEKIFHQF